MKHFLLVFLLLLPRAFAADTRDQIVREYHALTQRAEPLSDSARLAKLFDLDWRNSMLTYPEWATSVGYPGYDDRWTDYSEAAIEERKRDVQLPLAALRVIDRAQLSKPEQLHYDLFLRNQNLSLEHQRFPGELLPLNQLGGVQQDAARMLDQMPLNIAAHYENILARLRALPRLIEQNIALLRRGVAAGVTLPKITLRDVPQQIGNVIPAEPKDSALLRTFLKFPEQISSADQQRLKASAEQVYRAEIVPAFQRLRECVEKEYLPAARETIGWSSLPQGAEWYALAVRSHTTTNLSPQEIHDIGQREVARIRGEMDAVIAEAGFKGSFEEFSQFLRVDPRFYYTADEDLLRGYRDISKRIDPELGRLFGKLPRLPYGVRPVPAYAQKSQTTAYYESGSARSGRAGYFFANTHNLPARPIWEMEALTLHEAVPGHHLQLSLAQELENVPEWRKHDSYTAYVEGWGLYSESLGSELGLYTDPYQKFGKLSFEMWRACRLVVDTGMHALGWSRERAIEFMQKYSGKTEHNIVVEIDRYIVWPGQALSYKIGELKIRELRDRATAALGDRFDIRAFHDRILGQGALPLDLLSTNIDEWIAEQGGNK